jgi:hypothetical protein
VLSILFIGAISYLHWCRRFFSLVQSSFFSLLLSILLLVPSILFVGAVDSFRWCRRFFHWLQSINFNCTLDSLHWCRHFVSLVQSRFFLMVQSTPIIGAVNSFHWCRQFVSLVPSILFVGAVDSFYWCRQCFLLVPTMLCIGAVISVNSVDGTRCRRCSRRRLDAIIVVDMVGAVDASSTHWLSHAAPILIITGALKQRSSFHSRMRLTLSSKQAQSLFHH